VKEKEKAVLVRVVMGFTEKGQFQFGVELNPEFRKACSSAQLLKLESETKDLIKLVSEVMLPIVNRELGIDLDSGSAVFKREGKGW
jgi:hypothetical protein